MSEQAEVGATWFPAALGPHLWADFRPGRAADDLTAMRAAGFTAVRVHLAWDAFVPSHRQVSRSRLRDLDALLEAARPLGMRVVPVLMAQSMGGAVLLPRYAIDRRRPRRGVRVITDGVLESGGPRDQWADPLMLEVEVMWLEALLASFANHPAIAAWDLGHDPASVIRPVRIAHTAAWAELLGGTVRARGDRVRLTLGAGDVLSARGMRPAALAPHLDGLGLLLEPQRLGLAVARGEPDLAGTAFTVQLAMRLAADAAGAPPPLHAVTGLAAGDPADLEAERAVAAAEAARSRAAVRASLGLGPGRPSPAPAPPAEDRPAWDVPLLEPPEAERRGGELLSRLVDSGVAGVTATSWSTLTDRVATAPSLDRRPSLARHGLARPDGELREAGLPWARLARAESAVSASAPWPAQLDVEQYYASLPDSALDLLAAWRQERGEAAERGG